MTYLYKLFIFVLILSILRIVRESLYFWNCFNQNKKYEINPYRRFWLWSSIAYVITILITGF